MGILVNFISADEDELDAIGESENPVAEWSGVEARDLDIAKIVTLHSLLTGESVDDVIYAYEPVYGDSYGGPIVLRVPDEVMARLAGLDEEAAEAVGEELAYTVEFEMSNVPFEDVQSLLVELTELARIAESQGQVMFIWMHPLLT